MVLLCQSPEKFITDYEAYLHRRADCQLTEEVIERHEGLFDKTPEVLAAVRDNKDLADNLSAAAHLIHGSSEGRFTITYCPGYLTAPEVEGVNFRHGHLDKMMQRYNPARLVDGYNDVEGEEVFYVSNPALGLWAHRGRFA